MVARFVTRKRHDLALDALTRLRNAGHDVTLTLVGQAFGKESRDLERVMGLVQRSGHADAVRIVTNLSDLSGMKRLYREADALLLPSDHEPASVAVIEALANSLPVIVTETCGTASYVQHERHGLHVEEGSSNSIVKAVEFLLEDPSRLHAMREAAFERASTWMTPAAAARRMEAAVKASKR